MAATKTKPTNASVDKFIAGLENDTRRADARTLLKVFKESTGWKAQMLGPTIIGFGLFHYKYDTGHSGAACVVGFSPRKARLVIYAFDFAGKAELLRKLGKHKGGSDNACTSTNSPTLIATCSERSSKQELSKQRGRGPSLRASVPNVHQPFPGAALTLPGLWRRELELSRATCSVTIASRQSARFRKGSKVSGSSEKG